MKETKSMGGKWRLSFQTGGASQQISDAGEVDEVVLGKWLHVENLDRDVWWVRVGDMRMDVRIDEHGNATVSVEGPLRTSEDQSLESDANGNGPE